MPTSDSDDMTQPGDLLASRYRLHHHLASGGMGEVWAGRDELLDRPVAVKVVKREYADDPVFRERLSAEARAAASVRNPHVVATYDVGEAQPGPADAAPTPFIVMELLDGQPLSVDLRNGPLPPERVSAVLADVGDALRAAHDCGVVHRDIKPGNLIAEPDGRIVVVDFGIARAARSAGLTNSGVVLGTARYISPEQAAGKPAVPASDVYALGVVAYQALTGQPPFDAESDVAVALAHLHDSPPPLPASVPQPLADLVMRCLAKDPGQRPSAREVSSEARIFRAPVAALTATEPIAAAAVGETQAMPVAGTVPTQVLAPITPPPVWLRTRSLAIAGAVATVLIIALAIADPFGGGGSGQPVNAATTHSATPTATTSAASVHRKVVKRAKPQTTPPKPTPAVHHPKPIPPAHAKGHAPKPKKAKGPHGHG